MDAPFTNNQVEPHQVEQVAEGIIRIPVSTQTMPPATRTNAYLIDTGPSLWLMDPGSDQPPEIERIKQSLHEAPGINQRFKGYFITHRHRDHWSGLPALYASHPGVVVSHAPLNGNFTWAHTDEFLKKAPGFQVFHTPGHSPDHLAVLTAGNDLLAGDLVAGTGTILIASPEGNMSDYMNSLRAMISLAPGRIYPAHGPTLENGLERLQAYLEHRLLREAMTLKSLDLIEGKNPSDLLKTVYPEISEKHRWAATQSLLSHLYKLQQEGRALNREESWTLHENMRDRERP